MNLNKEFWSERYDAKETGWDVGKVSTPLKEYIDQLKDKSIRILVPGAGNGYEAEYLHNQGFKNVTVVDIAEQPLKNIKDRCPSFPKEHLICTNFFTHQGTYDLILEQTFFCALDKTLRPFYVVKMHQLLAPKGKLVGVLFGVPMFEDHPPFGGGTDEYVSLFRDYFDIYEMKLCYNSIPPRAGTELFIKLIKKENI